MKNIKYNIYLMVTLIIAMYGCTDDFSEINTNPNTVTHALPESLLSPAVYEFISYNLGRSKAINNELMQVTVTLNNNNDIHRYDITSTYSDGPWNNWYVELNNFRKMYTIAKELNQEAYMGIALILDSWGTSIITDTFGDVPDTEACRGDEGIYQPKFDKQEDIYANIFNKLDSANVYLSRATALDVDQASLDVLYGGDLTKWRKFGNSLYLRLLTRISKRASEAGIVEKINAIISDNTTYPLFQNNDDSAILRFTGTNPLLSPFHNNTNYDFRGNTGLSEFFINTLLDWEDPRLPMWASEASLGAYWGIQSGYAPGNTPDAGSQLLYDLRKNPLLGNIINYSEVEFLKAEAATRGWTNTVDAKTCYQNGIKSSLILWVSTLSTETAVLDSYITKANARWDETTSDNDKLEEIITQKYFALFFTDLQQWFEYRRTHYPNLPIGPGLLNNGKMPSRLKYPVYVQNLNREHYNQAVSSMGGDNINTVMWWDKE